MAQGTLGAAGIRHVWAGAGLQPVAYRAVGILCGFPHSLLHTAMAGIITQKSFSGWQAYKWALLAFHITFAALGYFWVSAVTSQH